MRALIIALVLGLAAAGGYFFYQRSAPAEGEQSKMFAPPPPPPPPPRAEDCAAENAVYEYADDRRLELRFRRLPARQSIEIAEMEGRQIGNVQFVVRATSFSEDYAFDPVNGGAGPGPQYETTITYLRPEAGGAQFPVTMFNTDMHYIGQLPRNDSPAPAFIFMPGMMRTLIQHRIDQPPGLFRFQRCEMPAATAP